MSDEKKLRILDDLVLSELLAMSDEELLRLASADEIEATRKRLEAATAQAAKIRLGRASMTSKRNCCGWSSAQSWSRSTTLVAPQSLASTPSQLSIRCSWCVTSRQSLASILCWNLWAIRLGEKTVLLGDDTSPAERPCGPIRYMRIRSVILKLDATWPSATICEPIQTRLWSIAITSGQ